VKSWTNKRKKDVRETRRDVPMKTSNSCQRGDHIGGDGEGNCCDQGELVKEGPAKGENGNHLGKMGERRIKTIDARDIGGGYEKQTVGSRGKRFLQRRERGPRERGTTMYSERRRKGKGSKLGGGQAV